MVSARNAQITCDQMMKERLALLISVAQDSGSYRMENVTYANLMKENRIMGSNVVLTHAQRIKSCLKMVNVKIALLGIHNQNQIIHNA